MTKKVCYVVRTYKTKRHGKAKSIKNCKGNYKMARDFASGRMNVIITRELR